MPNVSIATKPPALENSNKTRCRLSEQPFAAHIEENEPALVARPGIRTGKKGSIMPVKIFCVQGTELINGLESEINKWQKSLGSKASVTHTSTAMTEHKGEDDGWQTRLAVTIWYEL